MQLEELLLLQRELTACLGCETTKPAGLPHEGDKTCCQPIEDYNDRCNHIGCPHQGTGHGALLVFKGKRASKLHPPVQDRVKLSRSRRMAYGDDFWCDLSYHTFTSNLDAQKNATESRPPKKHSGLQAACFSIVTVNGADASLGLLGTAFH